MGTSESLASQIGPLKILKLDLENIASSPHHLGNMRTVTDLSVNGTIRNMKKFRACLVSINDSSGERESSEGGRSRLRLS